MSKHSPANTPVTRDKRGRWIKGTSPNPTGRPVRSQEFQEAAQRLAPEALEIIKKHMHDPDPMVSMAACKMVIERAYGKSPQPVVGAPGATPLVNIMVNAAEVTIEQAERAYLDLLKAVPMPIEMPAITQENAE